jgi:hypothetical protein
MSWTRVSIRREPRSPSSAISSRGQLLGPQDAGAQCVVDVVVDVRDAVDEADDLPLQGRRLVRPRVVEDPVARLHREIEAAPVPLERLHDAQRLLVVPEMSAEARGERLVEGLLARVPEGGVAEVVAERDRFRQILVQPQRARHGPGDTRRLEGVREPRAVVVAARVDEDLGLVPEAAERLAVDDAVAIALERGPQAALLLFLLRAPAGRV